MQFPFSSGRERTRWIAKQERVPWGVQDRVISSHTIFVEKRRVSLWEYGLFVIGLDSTSLTWKEEKSKDEFYKKLINHLKELCAEENCLFFQIETIDYTLQLTPFSWGGKVGIGGLWCVGKGWDEGSWDELREEISASTELTKDFWITQSFYKKFIPPYTAVIDLTQSEEEILTAMKPKGRYNIRLAEKKWVQVRGVEKNDENIEIFYRLMQETTSRDHFSWNTLRYYQNFLEQENTLLLFAEHEWDVLAACIFIYHGELMYYYYGASSSHKRNLMAPYLLQWNAAQKAKELGSVLYDFLGIAWPGETHSPLAGVTDFKLKLTPDIRQVSLSYLFIHKVWKYRAIQLLKYFKK